MASDWKTKYMDIRAKLKEATDVAWRLGYERGMKDGTQAAQMQAMAQQQQAQAAMMGGAPGGDPAAGGDPSQDPSMQGGDPSMAGAAPGGDDEAMMEGAAAPGAEEIEGADGGSELDQHINELQGLVAKGEKPSVLDIRKAVQAIAGIRKNQKNAWAKKVDKIIPAQKKVVDNILAKWEKEAKKPSEGLEEIIKQHGIKIGE
jgi:hypothetical protein